VNGPEVVQLRSSNLSTATYDPDSQTLTIEFNDGSSYDYFNVPQSLYRGLTLAVSAGKYFHAHIRDRFAYQSS
jgi:hypothetical protein